MRKAIFIHKKFSKGLYMDRVKICPNCGEHDFFEARVGCNWLTKMVTGSWWCRKCRHPFRSPALARVRKM